MTDSHLTLEDFQLKLNEMFQSAQTQNLTEITIKAGDLHRQVGVFPLPNHRMPLCCQVMRNNILLGDQILTVPPKGDGATLTILYKLPR